MSKKTIKDENGKKYTVKEKKPIYKKWWFWLIVVIILVGIFGSNSSDNSSSSSKSSTTKTEKKANSKQAKQTTKKDTIKNDDTKDAKKIENNTAQPVTLGAGQYKVGDQIKPGRYVIKAVNGSGNFTSEDGDINVILGQQANNESGQIDSYTTTLKKGTEIKIEGINQTSFTPVTSRTYLTQLTAGQWLVGKDIKPGHYKIVATAGSGNISSNNGSINEILGTSANSDTGQVTSINVNLHKGEVINSDVEGISLKSE